jgi:hypothetical protein
MQFSKIGNTTIRNNKKKIFDCNELVDNYLQNGMKIHTSITDNTDFDEKIDLECIQNSHKMVKELWEIIHSHKFVCSECEKIDETKRKRKEKEKKKKYDYEHSNIFYKNNVVGIDIRSLCFQSYPCQHTIKLTLKDGTKLKQLLGSPDIFKLFKLTGLEVSKTFRDSHGQYDK